MELRIVHLYFLYMHLPFDILVFNILSTILGYHYIPILDTLTDESKHIQLLKNTYLPSTFNYSAHRLLVISFFV